VGEAATLLLGLGNEILTDDAVGLLASRRIAQLVGDRVDYAEECVATIDLLTVLSGYQRVVVIDALLDPDLPPGSRVRATADDLPGGFGYRSFHTLAFRDMIEMGRRLEMDLPDEIVVHGLVVQDPVTFGEVPTAEVEDSWRAWADDIARTEFGWGSGV
jgi:hydrogenase maturation protease